MEPQLVQSQQHTSFIEVKPKIQGKYTIIHLQELPQVGRLQSFKKVDNQKLILSQMSGIQNFEIYAFKDTSNNHDRFKSRYHNFFGAFFQAYNTHGNVIFSPDDIWLTIVIFLSKYIEKNCEKLRHQFVMHKQKKQLCVWQYASSKEQSLEMQKQWEYFFEQIIGEIEKNTVAGVVQDLQCDFSTTDQIYRLMSTSTIMGALKDFFSYSRGVGCCGLSNIYFEGTLEDWHKIHKKLNNLRKYDVDGVLKKYIEQVSLIVYNLSQTFKGKVDLQWWNRIMSRLYRGSGSQKIEGWILHLFGIYGKAPTSSIPQTLVNVPIKLINQWTKKQKKLQMLTQWGSFSEVSQKTYKPNITMGIIERQQV